MKMSAHEELRQAYARVRSRCYCPVVSIGMTSTFLGRLAAERAGSQPDYYFKTFPGGEGWMWQGVPIQEVSLSAGHFYFETGVYNRHRWV